MTQKNKPVLLSIVAALIVAVVAVGWFVQSQRDTTGDEARAPGGEVAATDGPVTMAIVDEFGLGVGDEDAQAKVEIFFDFQCPHCADFENASRDALNAFAANGEAFVVHRPMAFLNEYSWQAMNAFAAVLDTGDVEAAAELKDVFLAEQPQDTMPNDAWYSEQATALGVDAKDAIDGFEFEQWIVNANDDASKRGVRGTPTVFVNGNQVTGSSIDELVSKMKAAVANANSTVPRPGRE